MASSTDSPGFSRTTTFSHEEFGLALGGTPGAVLRLILCRLPWLVGVGLAAGGVASYWAARSFSASSLAIPPPSRWRSWS